MLVLDGNSLSGTIPSDFLRHNNNTDSPISVGLFNNNITGTLPKSLERFEKLQINLVGNAIEFIPPELCEKGGWMGGLVEEFKCDAILCPVDTYSPEGRAVMDGDECRPCADGFPYLGAQTCLSDTSGEEPWQILAAFYLSMGGDKWTHKDGWEVFDDLFDGETIEEFEDMKVNICDNWYGVLCQNGVPTRLSLPDNDLFGNIPENIFDVAWEMFDLSDNNVQLESLVMVKNPENLTSLILSNIKLQSLDGIRDLKNLEQLYLDGLSIEEPLLDNLFDLTDLKSLHLQHGSFTGTIPTLIGRLTKLEL
jgi:Leucine-rich repeat (LRR) protein